MLNQIHRSTKACRDINIGSLRVSELWDIWVFYDSSCLESGRFLQTWRQRVNPKSPSHTYWAADLFISMIKTGANSLHLPARLSRDADAEMHRLKSPQGREEQTQYNHSPVGFTFNKCHAWRYQYRLWTAPCWNDHVSVRCPCGAHLRIKGFLSTKRST